MGADILNISPAMLNLIWLGLFILLLVIALMIALRLTPAVLWEKLRERPQYEPEPEDARSEQFDVSDNRTLDEVVKWLMEMDYIPSFCTACYREGRTGDRFMSLCKSGQIQNCCHPNALMTLKEYLMDYASPETKAVGDRLIEKEVLNVPNEKVRNVVLENLRLIEQDNRRDFRF